VLGVSTGVLAADEYDRPSPLTGLIHRHVISSETKSDARLCHICYDFLPSSFNAQVDRICSNQRCFSRLIATVIAPYLHFVVMTSASRSRSYLASPAGPLTTIYTSPPECLRNIYSVGAPCSSPRRSLSITRGRLGTGECLPDWTSGWKTQAGAWYEYDSPAVCPLWYTRPVLCFLRRKSGVFAASNHGNPQERLVSLH